MKTSKMFPLLTILLVGVSGSSAADARAFLTKQTNASTISVFNSSLTERFGFGVNLYAITPVLISSDGTTGYLFGQRFLSDSNNVFFEAVNLTSHRILSEVELPGGILNDFNVFIEGLLFSPDGQYLYAAADDFDIGTGYLLQVSLADNTVTVPYESAMYDPTGLAMSPDGSQLYMTAQISSGSALGSVLDIASEDFQVVNTYTVTNPFGIALSTDGTTAYVVTDRNTLQVLDLVSGRVTAQIAASVDTYPVISPDGAYLYITQPAGASSACSTSCIAQVRTSDLSVQTTTPIDASSASLTISTDGTELAVSTDLVSLFSLPALTTLATTEIATNSRVSFAPGTNVLYGTGGTATAVAVVDLTTHRDLAEFDGGDNPVAIVLSRNKSIIYVSNGESRVTVIGAAKGGIIAEIQLPGSYNDDIYTGPLVLSPDGSILYVGTTSGIAKISAATNQYLTTLPSSPKSSTSLAVSSDGTVIYATKGDDLFSFDSVTGAQLGYFSGGGSLLTPMNAVAVSPTGAIFALSDQLLFEAIFQFTDSSLKPAKEASLPLESGTAVFSAVVSPDGKNLYIAEGNVAVYNVQSNSFHRIATSGGDTQIAITPDGTQAVASSGASSGVADVIDLQTEAVTQVSVGGTTAGVAVQ